VDYCLDDKEKPCHPAQLKYLCAVVAVSKSYNFFAVAIASELFVP
jgi:hypothetical protein